MKEKLQSELFLFPMVWYFLICKAVGTISWMIICWRDGLSEVLWWWEINQGLASHISFGKSRATLNIKLLKNFIQWEPDARIRVQNHCRTLPHRRQTCPQDLKDFCRECISSVFQDHSHIPSSKNKLDRIQLMSHRMHELTECAWSFGGTWWILSNLLESELSVSQRA